MNQNLITPIRILEYVDCPQLFLARDMFDTQYLCLLYTDEPSCQYVAIRISNDRFAAFCQRQVDLRSLFISPEFEGEYFNVAFANQGYAINRMTNSQLPEDMLPDEGYLFDSSDSVNVTISIPRREQNLLLNLIRRHGWVAF